MTDERIIGPVKRDIEDIRDMRLLVDQPNFLLSKITPNSDMRPLFPEVYNQGPIGSCLAQSGCALNSFLHPEVPYFSRLQLYFNIRYLEGDVDFDAGGQTRNVGKVIKQWGVAPEAEWPYDVTQYQSPPPVDAILDGYVYRAASYSRLITETEMLLSLSSGWPFITGFSCPDYFSSDDLASHGVMWKPGGRFSTVGGHATVAVGHTINFKKHPDFIASKINPLLVDDVAILIRNSWGAGWGKAGHFWMPISWLSNPSTGFDNWTFRKMVNTTMSNVTTIDGIPIDRINIGALQ